MCRLLHELDHNHAMWSAVVECCLGFHWHVISWHTLEFHLPVWCVIVCYVQFIPSLPPSHLLHSISFSALSILFSSIFSSPLYLSIPSCILFPSRNHQFSFPTSFPPLSSPLLLPATSLFLPPSLHYHLLSSYLPLLFSHLLTVLTCNHSVCNRCQPRMLTPCLPGPDDAQRSCAEWLLSRTQPHTHCQSLHTGMYVYIHQVKILIPFHSTLQSDSHSNNAYLIITFCLGITCPITVEPPKMDSPYYGNLHNADKSPWSQIISCTIVYIHKETSVLRTPPK